MEFQKHNTYFLLIFRLGRRLFTGRPASFSLEEM